MCKNAKNQWLSLAFAVLFLTAMSPAFASEGAEGAKKDGPIYVDFKSIVIPVIKKDGDSGVVAFSMMAEVKDDAGKTAVTDSMPKLRDAFIRALYGNMEGGHLVAENGMLDIDRIKTRLLKSAEYVMKSEKDNPIKDLLFQNIAQQTY